MVYVSVAQTVSAVEPFEFWNKSDGSPAQGDPYVKD
jgi:hypothetical protein